MQLKRLIHVCFIFLTFFLNDVAAAQTLKVPYVSISGFQAPLYLGERAGLFKKNQLEAQLIYMPGGSLIVQLCSQAMLGSPALPRRPQWPRG
jgi:ABC-type nitrate/sulfonate/bicarbonate transport system substrate-binding protein